MTESFNPYEVTHDVPDQAVGVLSGNREDLRAVAKYQRRIILALLGYLGVMAFMTSLGFIRETLRSAALDEALEIAFYPIMALLVFCAIAGAVSVFLLSLKVHRDKIWGGFQAVFVLVPCLGLLVLALISGRATKILRQNGVRVGFLGAKPGSIRL